MRMIIYFVVFLTLPVRLDYVHAGMWSLVGPEDRDEVDECCASGMYVNQGEYSEEAWPDGRYYPAAFFHDKDSVLLFAGGQGSGNNDLWMWNKTRGVKGTWMWIKGNDQTRTCFQFGVFDEQNNPGSRRWTNKVSYRWNLFDEASVNDEIYVWGGRGWGVNVVQGVYKHSIRSWKFIGGNDTVQHPGKRGTLGEYGSDFVPSGRGDVTYFQDDKSFFSFGGESSLNVYNNDMFEYSISKNEWRWIGGWPENLDFSGNVADASDFHADNWPSSRGGYSGFYCEDYIVIFGGRGLSSSGGSTVYLGDMWKYNITVNQMKWMRGDRAGGSDHSGPFTPNEYTSSTWMGAHDESIVVQVAQTEAIFFGGYDWNNLMFGYDSQSNQMKYIHGDLGDNYYKSMFHRDPWGNPLFDVWAKDIFPSARYGSAYLRFPDGVIFVFGGGAVTSEGYDDGDVNELWLFSYPACSELPQHDPNVCGGDYSHEGKYGRGYCQSENVCICEEGVYSGNNCEFVLCGGLWSWEEGVCNNRGECIDFDRCACHLNLWDGNLCEVAKCNNQSASLSSVCSSNGECIDIDTCRCTEKHYYGFECNEKIEKTGVLKQEKDKNATRIIIQIKYEISRKTIEEFQVGMVDVFPCQHIIVEEDLDVFGEGEGGGNSSLCHFSFSRTDVSNYLVIEVVYAKNNQIPKKKKFTLRVIPVSDPYVNVTVLISRKTTQNQNLALFLVLGGVLLVGVVIFCTVSVVALICTLVIRRQRRKLKKFDVIKDEVDILLKEQELEKQIFLGMKFKINKDLFIIDPSSIKLIEHLGSGGSGTDVFKCLWKSTVAAYKAFKNIASFVNEEFYGEYISDFEKEISIMARLSKHIINFFGACINKNLRVGIVLEFAGNGNIQSYIQMLNQTDSRCEFSERIRFLYEASLGIDYLHSKNILHRDVKCENLLLSDALEVKVCDFGASRSVKSESDTLTQCVGTSGHISPEVFSGKKNYNNKVDVFSFGVVCFVVYEGLFHMNEIYGNVNNIDARISSDCNFRPKFRQNRNIKEHAWFFDLCSRCWDHDPSKRPTMDDCVKILGVKSKKKKKKRKGGGGGHSSKREEEDREYAILAEQESILDRETEELQKELDELKMKKKTSNV